jgi:hypothetical protein
MHSYEKGAYVADIIAKLILDKDAVFNYTWHQGLLRYKSRVWVGCDQDLQQKLITACHSFFSSWWAFRNTCDFEKTETDICLKGY